MCETVNRSTKKLLIIGTTRATKYAIEYAKSIGIYTILADYLPVEKNATKLLVDEHWETDIYDVDTLEKQARESGVTAIYSDSNEPCLDTTKELCSRLNLPFYASDKGWRAARDKAYFKSVARSVGISVPSWIELNENSEQSWVEDVDLPVIIKPIDAAGGAGITICKDKSELIPAYNNALENSPSKNVIVEQYIQGTDVTAFFVMREGKPFFQYASKVWLAFKDNDGVVYPNLYSGYIDSSYDSLHLDQSKLEALCSALDAENGVFTLQGILVNDVFSIFEFGYRLDGAGMWQLGKMGGGVDQVKLLVDCALGRPVDEVTPVTKPAVVHAVWLLNGTLGKIEGFDQACAMEGVSATGLVHQVGDVITQETQGLRREFASFNIVANTTGELVKKIADVDHVLDVRDTEGKKMILTFTLPDDFDVTSDIQYEKNNYVPSRSWLDNGKD